MRKVKKDFSNVPPVLKNATCDALIAEALILKGKHAFKTEVYGHEEVRWALDGIYNGKCAFCETDTSAGATMQVEHYRPKAKVTGAAYVISVQQEGEKTRKKVHGEATSHIAPQAK